MIIEETWLREVYRLRGLKRYNDRIQIKGEDVAQHCFFTSLIVLKLSLIFRFHVGKAVRMATLHDLPEIDCSDVSHKVKMLFPDIAKAIKAAEAQIMETKFPAEWARLVRELELGETIEAQVVLLADAISVWQYADCELALGNRTPEMLDIMRYTEIRISALEEKLKARFQKPQPKYLSVEGLDRAGKSYFGYNLSLIRPEWPKHNYITIRGPLSCLVFNELYGRGLEPEAYWSMFSYNALVAYINCPIDTILERIETTEHVPISRSTLVKTEALFQKHIAQAIDRGIEVIQLDGSKDPDDVVHQFLSRLT